MKRFLLGVLSVGAVAAGGAVWYWPRANGPETLRLPGTVEVQEVRLGSRVGGRVVAVTVAEGETTEPKRVLVTFDPAELTARRDKAKAHLASAVAAREKADRGPLPEEVAEAKAATDAARARLAKSAAGFRDEEKRQTEQELKAAVADYQKADADYSRVERLRNAGAGAAIDHDAARATRDRAAARVKALQTAYELLTTGSRVEDIDEAKAEVARFDARYKLLLRGTRDEDKAAARAAVAAAEAELAEAESLLKEAVVVSPERYVIETVAVRPGDLVPAGRPVVVAHRADDLWVKVFVPATDLGRLRLGQAVEVAVDSHPGRRFPGAVVYIAAVSEFTPRNVQSADERKHQVFAVKVRVTEPGGVFKSGMAAEVFVPLAE